MRPTPPLSLAATLRVDTLRVAAASAARRSRCDASTALRRES